MSRTPLVVGAIVVLAAAVALIVMLKNSGESDASEPSSETASTATPMTQPPITRDPSVVVTDRPRLPAGSEPALPPEGEHPREYAVGDYQVRDHRAGDNKPLDIAPNAKPANARLIPSSLTHVISQGVKAVVKDCTADLPRDGRGTKPRLEGQILIAIKNHTVSVTSATIQMRDLEGAAVETAKQCVQTRSIGLTTPAPEEDDMDSYSINLSYAIP